MPLTFLATWTPCRLMFNWLSTNTSRLPSLTCDSPLCSITSLLSDAPNGFFLLRPVLYIGGHSPQITVLEKGLKDG
ncbi:uncharacterized protein LOC135424592 isoform X2 [Pseudopipra pipra]|uniref:uncharacterized protein LOC135424592 isoform X2 n=1 Tax=Pseudopipra pipra TaxID=415032 RepID=UPI003138823C